MVIYSVCPLADSPNLLAHQIQRAHVKLFNRVVPTMGKKKKKTVVMACGCLPYRPWSRDKKKPGHINPFFPSQVMHVPATATRVRHASPRCLGTHTTVFFPNADTASWR